MLLRQGLHSSLKEGGGCRTSYAKQQLEPICEVQLVDKIIDKRNSYLMDNGLDRRIVLKLTLKWLGG